MYKSFCLITVTCCITRIAGCEIDDCASTHCVAFCTWYLYLVWHNIWEISVCARSARFADLITLFIYTKAFNADAIFLCSICHFWFLITLSTVLVGSNWLTATNTCWFKINWNIVTWWLICLTRRLIKAEHTTVDTKYSSLH